VHGATRIALRDRRSTSAPAPRDFFMSEKHRQAERREAVARVSVDEFGIVRQQCGRSFPISESARLDESGSRPASTMASSG
jgi:hypothetical protein